MESAHLQVNHRRPPSSHSHLLRSHITHTHTHPLADYRRSNRTSVLWKGCCSREVARQTVILPAVGGTNHNLFPFSLNITHIRTNDTHIIPFGHTTSMRMILSHQTLEEPTGKVGEGGNSMLDTQNTWHIQPPGSCDVDRLTVFVHQVRCVCGIMVSCSHRAGECGPT